MRTVIVFCLFMMACSGCAIVTSGPFSPKAGAAKLPRELQLMIGMSKAEVSSIMERTVVVGYEVDPSTGSSKPIKVSSLVSTEFVTQGKKTYQVDKYIIREDSSVAVTVEDLLYPVVFEHGLLVAKGRQGLEKLIGR